MTVVDNGTVVDLFLGRLERRQLGVDQLNAPHLIDSEFVSSVRGLALGGQINDRTGREWIKRFSELAIKRHATTDLGPRVWELRHNLTAYDATYVALAEALDTSLVTTDSRITRAPGIRCPVQVL